MIVPLGVGGAYICAGRRDAYDDRDARGYAFLGEPGAGETRDLEKLIRMDSEKCRLFVRGGRVVTVTPSGAGQIIKMIEPSLARVHITLNAKLASHGFLIGVDRAAECGLFSDGEKATVRRLDESLAPLASSAAAAAPDAAWVATTEDGWVVANHALDSRRERRSLIVLDRKGRPVREHRLPGILSQVVVAANGALAACALIGGEVALVELASGETRRFKPHQEAKKKDWVRIVLEPRGAYFLSWITTGGSLNRTDLETGSTTPLLELRWVTREETFAQRGWFGKKAPKTLRLAYVPDFTLHGTHLLTLEARTVCDRGDPRILSIGESFPSELERGATRPVKYSPRRGLEDNLRGAGLGAHQETIRAFWWPGIELAAQRTSTLVVGQSRLGGQPDCPPAFEWPSYQATPMAFLAQIDLTDAAPYAVPGLPARGWLLIFIALEAQGWPLAMSKPTRGPERFEMLEIIHVDAESVLSRLAPPEAITESQRFAPCPLRATRRSNALPADDSAAVKSWGLGAEATAAYRALCDQVNGDTEDGDDDGPRLQLAGYPHVIQDNMMEYEAEAAMRGQDPDRIQPDISAADAAHWRLLLQVPSHGPSGVDWGEMSALYLWVRSDHLSALDFDRVYMTMQ